MSLLKIDSVLVQVATQGLAAMSFLPSLPHGAHLLPGDPTLVVGIYTLTNPFHTDIYLSYVVSSERHMPFVSTAYLCPSTAVQPLPGSS